MRVCVRTVRYVATTLYDYFFWQQKKTKNQTKKCAQNYECQTNN